MEAGQQRIWSSLSLKGSQQRANALLLLGASLICAVLLAPSLASAGVFELSTGFSYNKSDYGGGNFEWNRHWGGSFGFHFTERSSIEASYSDNWDRTKIANFQDTTFHDKVYSVDWNQALTGKDFPVQPYFKLGVGQLNRDASGSYSAGVSPPAQVDSLTVIVGAGLRLYMTRYLAIRTEATTYLTGGAIGTYKDNVSFTIGLSLFF